MARENRGKELRHSEERFRCERLDFLPNREIFMAMMTPASHEFVDLKLREAAEAIERAQSATAVKKGYVNFEMAARILYECRTAIDQEMENDAVIGHLKAAAVALAAFNVGDAAASVQAAMRSIKAIVDKLPD
jgi:hypothetical protein